MQNIFADAPFVNGMFGYSSRFDAKLAIMRELADNPAIAHAEALYRKDDESAPCRRGEIIEVIRGYRPTKTVFVQSGPVMGEFVWSTRAYHA